MGARRHLLLFPVGLIGTVASIALFGAPGLAVAIAWGYVVFPYGARYVCRRWQGGSDQRGVEEDTGYWRTSNWLVR